MRRDLPIAALPAGIKLIAIVLPWTHCLHLLRFGLMGNRASGLDQIWPHASWPAAMLSLAALAAFAALTQGLAHRSFTKSTVK